jgi:hypothetical protein
MNSVPRKQAGASLLEFLIVIPVLLTLAYTAIEFGTIFVRLDTLTKSVQDATRYLSDVSVNKSNTPAQKTIAENLIKYGSVVAGPQLLPGVFDAPIISHPDANHVGISVVYHHVPVGGEALSNLLQFKSLGGGDGIELDLALPASSTMRYAQ